MSARMELVKVSSKVDMRKLPALSKEKLKSVELPVLYKQARSALQKVVRIDECKDISDKHTAIATYAKQIKDDSLLYYAQRVKLRAIERMGELLNEIKDPNERKKIQKEHAIAPITAANAMNVATVPKRVLDKMIDGVEKPSTLRRICNFATHGHNDRLFGWFEHNRRESLVKPTAEDQAERLIEYMESVVTDLDSFLQDYCGKDYTPKELGRAMKQEDVNTFKTQMNHP